LALRRFGSRLRVAARRIVPTSLRGGIRQGLTELRSRATSLRLARLRGRLLTDPPRTSGVERFAGYTVRIADGPSFYMQYKDEFVRRIYDFVSLRPDPLILDGGSNIGMSVLYFKQMYPHARVICFEPDPKIFAVLQENVSQNNLSDVALVNAGLGASEGRAAFMPDGSDGGRVVSGEGVTEIATVRLSAYLGEPVDFLKLNIEGEELPVLKEAAASGRLQNVRELVVEYHGWSNGEQRLGEILGLLDREGFRYLVHDFDSETAPSSKPPFRLGSETTWFCLVYARRNGS
jgi:FkbM family methyltransferase